MFQGWKQEENALQMKGVIDRRKANLVQHSSSDKTQEHFTTKFCEVATGGDKTQPNVRKNTSQQCSSDKTREHFTTMSCEVASGSRKRQLKVRKNTSQQCLASLKF